MSPLPAGAPAPAFSLPGTSAGGEREYRLADMAGRVVILAFYPGDDTPVCTRQLCSYQSSLGDLSAAGATLWGISRQGLDSHRRFAAKHGLAFPLLADVDGAVHRAYGLSGVLHRRAVFVVGPDGGLGWTWSSATSLRFVPAAEVAAAVRGLGDAATAGR